MVVEYFSIFKAHIGNTYANMWIRFVACDAGCIDKLIEVLN